jgi:hypothetical protein
MELLLLAFVANREGRALTEPQANARQACQSAIRTECLRAGRRTAAGFEDRPSLRQIMVTANFRRLTRQELELVHSGLQAQQEGRAVSTDEATALQSAQSGWKRLCEMAGYCNAGG